MLQILRNKSQSIVIQIIVVVIALVFIFWGVGTNLMKSNEAAIVVNGEEISFQDFQLAYDRAYNNVRNQFGDNIPQQLLEQLGIKQQVINQLIQESLLRQGAAEMGVTVSREEVRETVQNMVQFQEDGKFNIDKYKSILAANRYSPFKFEESIQTDMLSQKVSQSISNFAEQPTEYEINDLYRLENAKVAFSYVSITPDSYLDTITVLDEDLQKWYLTVQDNYKTAPQVKLKYLDYSYETVGKKIIIDETAVRNYYDQNASEFSIPEQRQARHILIKVEKDSTDEEKGIKRQKAEEILDMAKSGADFAQLATEYSEGPTKSRGGDLGLVSQNQMVKPFNDALFAMQEGSISDIVETSFGFHIIKLEKIIPAQTKPFDSEKESIQQKLKKEQAKPLAFQVANQAYEGIIGAGSLDAYIQNNPEESVIETDFFSKTNPPGAFEKDPKFLDAAFRLKEGELSSLIETSAGYTIIYAEAVKEPAVPELGAVKEKALVDYKKDKAHTLASESATTLLADARTDSSLEKAAEKGGFTVQDSGYLSKNSQSNTDVAPAMIGEAFKLSAKEPFPAEPLENDGKFYVFQFIGQQYPEISLTDEEKERYSSAILQMKRQQVLSAWLENRRAQSKVFTHQSL